MNSALSQHPQPSKAKEDSEELKGGCSHPRSWAAAAVVLAIAGALAFALWSWKPSGRSDLQPQMLMEKPRADHRSYQYTVLPNGLAVVNVLDATALTGAYSVAVSVGSFDDPPELPGLAHFCEHMVFLGTQRFPQPSGYDDFVSANGGYLNAYTAQEATVYYTELSQTAVKAGLERFADFFRAPLFSKRYVEKEVHSIDSEHAKNVQDPGWRSMAIMSALADPRSPVGRFHTGDLETLYTTPKRNGIDTVDSLRTWFSAHYCPSKMHLVTFGPDPLQVQLERAQQDFGDIAAGSDACQAPRRSWATPPAWPAETHAKWVNVQGTQPQTEMAIMFPLPDFSADFRSQPTQYISYVLSYTGENSLAEVLRAKLQLVRSIDVSAETTSAGGNLWVTFRLTPAGREKPDLVLDVLFHYLSTLRTKGVDLALYESLANVSKLSWDWGELKSASSAASELAERMTRLPPEHLLSGDSVVKNLDEAAVDQLLGQLVPSSMLVTFTDPDAETKLFEGHNVSTVPHYNIRYTVAALNERFPGALGRWEGWLRASDSTGSAEDVAARLRAAAVSGDLAMPVPPGPIPGVPAEMPLDNLHAAAAPDGSVFGARPGALRRQSSDAWYRRGWVTTSPTAQLQLVLRPRRKRADWEVPELDALRLRFYTDLLAETLSPKTADLAAAGASFGLSLSAQGVALSLGGYPSLIPELVSKVLAGLKGFSVRDPSRYNLLLRDFNESLLSFPEMPVDYALRDRNVLLTLGARSQEEAAAALGGLSAASVSAAAAELLLSRPLELTSLSMGNIGESEAAEVLALVHAGFSSAKGTTEGEVMRVTPVVRTSQPVELRKKNPRQGDNNDVAVVTLVAGVSTVEGRVLLGLLGQILSTVAYTELRTNRQLGYVVNAGSSQVSNVQYISTVVQGSKLRADAAEAAIEALYMDIMPRHLEAMSEEDFQSYRDAFAQQLQQPPVGFSEEFDHFWGPIASGSQCFGLEDEMMRFLTDSLPSKQPLLDAWNILVLPSTGARRKVTVKYFAGDVPQRPSREAARALWRKQGVPEEGSDLLSEEYGQTRVLDRADSASRAQLAAEGGFFPTELHCALASGNQAWSPGYPAPAPRRRLKTRGGTALSMA